MKKISLIFLALSLFSNIVFANGTNFSESKFTSVSSSRSYLHNREFDITVNLIPGSLKANIERIARNHGWHKVVWNVHSDYNWVGNTKIRGKNLVLVMEHILDGYPLQAVFYQGNRILVIEARTVR